VAEKMRAFSSIDAFVVFLRSRPAAVRAAQKDGAHEAGAFLVHEARELIGTEDETWPPLADVTILIKEEMGLIGRVSSTDPLLRHGEMRASIESTTTPDEVVLGTHDPVAMDQEFGTKSIPPRPFISLTMIRHGHEAAKLVYDHVMAAFCGEPPPKAKDHHSINP
jgi:hypothetical protein